MEKKRLIHGKTLEEDRTVNRDLYICELWTS